MRKGRFLFAAVLLCFVAVPMFAANPGGGTTECNNTQITPISSTTIPNNLHVPAGATCWLNWVR